ncbi:MAG: hypothetical protein RL136_2262 [Planctomycetota bacterium]|jgi:hypothetical protein
MPRILPLIVASMLLPVPFLAACGDGNGGYAPSPAPFTPPAQDLTAAKDPKFRPVIQAILAQRKASKDLAAFRAGFGSGPMDEDGGKKYGELFAKVAEQGDKVGQLAAGFEGEDRRVFDLIASLTDAQLESLLNP